MRLKRTLLWSLAVVLLFIFQQPAYGDTFSFDLRGADVGLAIDFEGTGTITHMNSPQTPPTPVDRHRRTSLLDLNILSASDLRVAMSGGQFRFTLFIVNPGVISVSYAGMFPILDSPPFFELLSPPGCSQLTCGGVFALNSIQVTQLQNLIDLYGADNLFLALNMERLTGSEMSFTVFSASEPVPEPTTMLLVATGLAGLTLIRKRRHR